MIGLLCMIGLIGVHLCIKGKKPVMDNRITSEEWKGAGQ